MLRGERPVVEAIGEQHVGGERVVERELDAVAVQAVEDDEADAVLTDLGVLAEDLERDAGDRDVREPEVEGRGADEPRALVPVVHDPAVVDLDPGGEAVRLAEPVLGAEAFQVALLEAIGRRRVVAREVLAQARGDELVLDRGEALGALGMMRAHFVP